MGAWELCCTFSWIVVFLANLPKHHRHEDIPHHTRKDLQSNLCRKDVTFECKLIESVWTRSLCLPRYKCGASCYCKRHCGLASVLGRVYSGRRAAVNGAYKLPRCPKLPRIADRKASYTRNALHNSDHQENRVLVILSQLKAITRARFQSYRTHVGVMDKF